MKKDLGDLGTIAKEFFISVSVNLFSAGFLPIYLYLLFIYLFFLFPHILTNTYIHLQARLLILLLRNKRSLRNHFFFRGLIFIIKLYTVCNRMVKDFLTIQAGRYSRSDE